MVLPHGLRNAASKGSIYGPISAGRQKDPAVAYEAGRYYATDFRFCNTERKPYDVVVVACPFNEEEWPIDHD